MTQPTKWERVRDRVAPFLELPSKKRFLRELGAVLKSELTDDPEEDLESHSRAAILVSALGHPTLALSWLDSFGASCRDDARLAPQVNESIRVVRVVILMNARRREESDALYESIDWSKSFENGWIRNLRLAKAVTDNRRDFVIEALRSRKSSTLRLSRKDRAATLLLLAEHFLCNQSDHCRAEGILGKAREIFAAEDHFDWHWGLARVDEMLGLIALHQDRPEESRRSCRDAAWRYASLGLQAAANRSTSVEAEAQICLAEYAKARELLCKVLASPPGARDARRQEAPGAMMARARLAVVLSFENKTAEALQWLQKATRWLKRCDTPKYRAIYLELKARVLGYSGKPALLSRAFLALDQAESLYSQIGDGYELGLTRVRCLRAELYIRKNQARAALDEVALCARTRAYQMHRQLQDDVLLVKSRALLLKDVPRPDRLYEDVLSNLGLARNPVTLFRVCANLYLYSWDLKDDLELMDYHLRQVNRMAEHLPGPTFARLYTEHVTLPILERAMVKTLRISS